MLATTLPFLLFAGLSLAVVGHLGLVPFGGTNLVDLAACLLDAYVVRQLPEEHRGPARRMLEPARRDRAWLFLRAAPGSVLGHP